MTIFRGATGLDQAKLSARCLQVILRENIIDRLDSITGGPRVILETLPSMWPNDHGRSLLSAVRRVVLLYVLPGRAQSPSTALNYDSCQSTETGRCELCSTHGANTGAEIDFKGLRSESSSRRASRLTRSRC